MTTPAVPAAVPAVSLKTYQFFRDHGACMIGHHARVGLALARAWMRFQEVHEKGRARFIWDHDEGADISWMDARDLKAYRGGRYSMECCRLELWRDEDERSGFRGRWETVASLGGIHLDYSQASDDYRRVIEAELAAEGLA